MEHSIRQRPKSLITKFGAISKQRSNVQTVCSQPSAVSNSTGSSREVDQRYVETRSYRTQCSMEFQQCGRGERREEATGYRLPETERSHGQRQLPDAPD